MMRATILLKPKRYIKKKTSEPVYDSNCLKQEDVRNNFYEKLEIKAANLEDNINVEITWNNIKKIFTHTMEKKESEKM